MNEKLPIYGGQAVIEGVMMRGSQGVAIAMRAPNHEIVIHTEPLSAIYRSKIIKIPFLRGLIALWDALGLGMSALTISANTQTGEEEKLEGWQLTLTLVISLGLGLGLFLVIPAASSQLSQKYLHMSGWWSNLVEGVIRLFLVVGYIWLAGRSAEIQRVFAYHGAEHKTINAFEAGAELSPESVARFPLAHTRCGTAFLLTLVLLSVLFFSLLGPLPPLLHYGLRLLLLPVLAGIAYEYLRWTAKHMDWAWVRLIVKPNLALQSLTTRQPTLEMLEVSIAAFNAMRALETQVSL